VPVLPSSLTNERCQPLPGVRSSAMMRTSSGHPRREVLAGSALAAALAIALTACSPAPPSAAFPTATATPTASLTSVPDRRVPTTARAQSVPPSRPKSKPSPRPSATVVVTPPGQPISSGQLVALEAVRDYSIQLLAGIGDRSSARLRALSAPDCRQCRSDAELIDERVKLGRRFVNLDGTVGWSQIVIGLRPPLGDEYVVNAQLVEAPNKFVGTGGRVIQLNRRSKYYRSTYVVKVSEPNKPQIVSITDIGS